MTAAHTPEPVVQDVLAMLYREKMPGSAYVVREVCRERDQLRQQVAELTAQVERAEFAARVTDTALTAVKMDAAELVGALKSALYECDWHRDNGYMQQKAMCAKYLDDARAILAKHAGGAL